MTTLSVASLQQSLGDLPPDNIIFGRSEALQAIRAQLARVAAANVPVLGRTSLRA
jgi:DNA-binding NtrC family response regulator